MRRRLLTIRLLPREDAQLRALAKRTDKSMADIVRRALREHFERTDAPSPPDKPVPLPAFSPELVARVHTIQLLPREDALLRAEAERTDKSMNDIVRRALREHFKRADAPLLNF